MKTRLVLVNKRTGRIASGNNWLTAMAAQAAQKKQVVGLPALLPQEKARKLLRKNKLDERPTRTVTGKEKDKARNQAQRMIPALAVLYEQSGHGVRPQRNRFCKWVVEELKNDKSRAYRVAADRDYNELLEGKKNWRWWLTRLQKMQS